MNRNQLKHLIGLSIVLLSLLAVMAHAQIPATVTTTIDGKQYAAEITLLPTTQPTTSPVVIVPPVIDVPATLAGRPSAITTGIKPGISLKPAVAIKAGGVYDGYAFAGVTVTLKAGETVTFRNCRFSKGAPYGIRAPNNLGRVIVDHCEIADASDDGFSGDGIELTNSYVHGSGGDGGKPGHNCLIRGNYFTDLGTKSGAHADGIQIVSGSNIVIDSNFFDMPIDMAGSSSNASLFLQRSASNVTFSGNWCRGGNFTIHAYTDTAGAGPSIKIINNVFYSGSARYTFGAVGSTVVWSGNLTDGGREAKTSSK